jgi:prepilin-type N-terminal cleavage/methylation domain-containing protein
MMNTLHEIYLLRIKPQSSDLVRGFTLVELLVSVAITSLVAVTVYASFKIGRASCRERVSIDV